MGAICSLGRLWLSNQLHPCIGIAYVFNVRWKRTDFLTIDDVLCLLFLESMNYLLDERRSPPQTLPFPNLVNE